MDWRIYEDWVIVPFNHCTTRAKRYLHALLSIKCRSSFCVSTSVHQPPKHIILWKIVTQRYCLGRVSILIALTMQGYVYEENNFMILKSMALSLLLQRSNKRRYSVCRSAQSSSAASNQRHVIITGGNTGMLTKPPLLWKTQWAINSESNIICGQ